MQTEFYLQLKSSEVNCLPEIFEIKYTEILQKYTLEYVEKIVMHLKIKQKMQVFNPDDLFFNHSGVKSGKLAEKRLTRCEDSL